jgi:hypothetical protein
MFEKPFELGAVELIVKRRGISVRRAEIPQEIGCPHQRSLFSRHRPLPLNSIAVLRPAPTCLNRRASKKCLFS